MSGTVDAIADLLDATFLESLQGLRIVARRVPRGGRHAEQRSQDLGSGIEFRDYRPYAPGDDLRAIDWNIYRRLGKVFLRLFEELEDLPLYLLPDISGSMFLEQPPRARAALRAALAFAAISLDQHDTVTVMPFAEDLDTTLRPYSGAGRILVLAQRLAALQPGGNTDTVRAIERLRGARRRSGLVVVISDFFDPRGIDAVLAALGTLRHRMLLVQLTRPSDADPALQGDLRLRDCESGEAEDVSVTPAVLERYRDAYRRFTERLTSFSAARSVGLLRLDVEREIVPQLAELFSTGAYAV